MARPPTKGSDGVLRFTLSVDLRVGRDEIAAALLFCRADDLQLASRTDGRRLGRDYLREYGSKSVADTLSSVHGRIRNQAYAVVDKHFSDLTNNHD